MTNDLWPQQEYFVKFYKSSSVSLDCISISELCSAINRTVATVHVNFTS